MDGRNMVITSAPEMTHLPASPLRFDRRRAERHRVEGQVTVLRKDHDPQVYRHPVCALRLENLGDGGLAAVSETPLEVNERIAVYFPPHGFESGIELHGHVIRCDRASNPDAAGYEIAVQFDLPLAA